MHPSATTWSAVRDAYDLSSPAPSATPEITLRTAIDGDRKHQRPSDSTRTPPEAFIQRRLPPRQLVTPACSTFQHRQRPQSPSCGSSWTESSLPVALLASDVLPRVRRYGGPLAERASDASTRSVAGGITTVRSCIA